VEHRLQAMPVEIEDERGVVARVVAVADTGRSVVDAARGECGGVEAIHRLARGGGEREMKARTGGSRINAARKDRKRRLAGESRRTVRDVPRIVRQAHVAERCQDCVVEDRRAIEIGDAEGEVVEHDGTTLANPAGKRYRHGMKVILFGATGMVGQSVLRECLRDDGVEAVLSVGRRASGQTHPKLRELVRADLFDFDGGAAELRGYDACFFCLGVSSAGMSEADYTRMTHDLTLGWAKALAKLNPAMTFEYVSGRGTGGKAMWAQVKGRTEDELLALFPSAYMIRLGILRPMNGEVSSTRWTRVAYAAMKPLLPLVRAVAPGMVLTSEELGRAMIHAARAGAPKRVLEISDLRALGAP